MLNPEMTNYGLPPEEQAALKASASPEAEAAPETGAMAQPEQEPAERPNVELDPEAVAVGARFAGASGEYEFTHVSELLKEENSLLECRVRDQAGQEFFMHNKHAQEQVLAQVMGEYFMESKAPEMFNFQYPEMRLETINGQDVALMEYFDHHRDLEDDSEDERQMTPEQKAYLNTVNLWLGNSDFKEDHILVDAENPGEFALIDFDRAFDSGNPEFIADCARRLPFLGEGEVPPAAYREFLNRLNELGDEDRQKIIQRAVDSGVDPAKAAKLVNKAFARRGALSDELQTIHDLRREQERIEREMFGE